MGTYLLCKCQYKNVGLGEYKNVGSITPKQYVMLAKDSEESVVNLEKKIYEINDKIDKIKRRNNHLDLGEIEKIMKKFFKFQIPANELLADVIDKITVDKERNIEIFFKKNVSKYIQLEKKEVKISIFASKHT